MIRFLIFTLSIAALSIAVQANLPWWTLAFVAFIVGAVGEKNNAIAFFSGMLGIGLTWMIYAYIIHSNTNSGLAERIAELVKVNSPFLLIILTGIIGGLVGGMSSLTGYRFRQLFS